MSFIEKGDLNRERTTKLFKTPMNLNGENVTKYNPMEVKPEVKKNEKADTDDDVASTHDDTEYTEKNQY